eukprot:scaffold3805_cov162-Ochromonas_danica.AAC.2
MKVGKKVVSLAGSWVDCSADWLDLLLVVQKVVSRAERLSWKKVVSLAESWVDSWVAHWVEMWVDCSAYCSADWLDLLLVVQKIVSLTESW